MSVGSLSDWLAGGLNLSVGDLGDWLRSARHLDLAVRDLRERLGSRSRGGLNLSIANLSDLGASRRGLDLSVTDLSDLGTSGGSLRLSITNLRNLGSSRRCLGLTISSLGSRRSRGLAVSTLSGAGATRRSTARDDGDDNGDARSTSGLVVQVVEGTRETLVEDGGAAKSERAVVADRPSTGVNRTGLSRRTIKLELSVRNDRTNASLGISEDATLEAQNECSIAAASRTLLGRQSVNKPQIDL